MHGLLGRQPVARPPVARRHRAAAPSRAQSLLLPVPAAAKAQQAQQHAFTATDNYANLRSNTGTITSRPVSGYAGRWMRCQGANLRQLLAEGDIIYGFRAKPGQADVSQVWKAEEGDLDSPRLQKQRDQLPQLQKDPLQLQLNMDTLIVEVSEALPLLDPTLSADLHKLRAGAEPHPAGLSGCMRVLAVPEWGNLVVTGGLPPVGKQGLPDAFKSWFNRMYLRVPGPDGGRRWSVMLHYDTSSGGFLTHYHTWETAITPAPDTLQQVFTPGAHKQVLQHAQESSCGALGSIEKFVSEHGSRLGCTGTTICYDDDMSSSISAFSGASSSCFAQAAGGPQPAEVWYGSGCYFRAPSSLADCAVAGKEVVLEAGAVFRDDGAGSGATDGGADASLVRWLLCYSSTGDRRLLWARHEVHRPAGT